MNCEKITSGLNFLVSDKRITVVYGALKRLHVSYYSTCYDDLFQEGCLAFGEAFAAYPGCPQLDDRFMAYAYQRIYWRLLDILQQSNQHTQQVALSDADQDPVELVVDPRPACEEQHLINADYFTTLAAHCSFNQRRYLNAKLNRQWSDKEIADHYKVSPSAVHQWKTGLIAKARRLSYNGNEFEVRK
ncbi:MULTISPECIES: sigma-70 family RNA polymerase sigma factor [Limosilactobacillus]|jgi:RNA polymerase sigma factor (sigma-70 family)|uniref:RNA polymerase sigma factor, sigma-70 family n=1 Tax=Limosilactobacillus panis DSM 6035 TaxID=1423782 RepID=A0A0R1XJV6_9LACO|nr:sigma-70 family RNA polymerase sigma factor [Limosilactobacillus panis]KRM29997.1 RNA polymerase sigma factor, sigma-70 family [Limosilactobacillus panis DSM 6035]QZN92398.1 sigma-70 family RNA polymerase sigma factor [Limosilactobacillus panis]